MRTKVHKVSSVDESTMMGDCSKCGITKVYRKSSNTKKGFYWQCKHQKDKYKGKVHYYKSASGVIALSSTQRFDIMKESDGACEICKEVLDLPHVDHCHETGKFRGILCARCNWVLGRFQDSEELFINAAHYLAKYR